LQNTRPSSSSRVTKMNFECSSGQLFWSPNAVQNENCLSNSKNSQILCLVAIHIANIICSNYLTWYLDFVNKKINEPDVIVVDWAISGRVGLLFAPVKKSRWLSVSVNRVVMKVDKILKKWPRSQKFVDEIGWFYLIIVLLSKMKVGGIELDVQFCQKLSIGLSLFTVSIWILLRLVN